jgi:hypothetical protein
LHQYSDAVFHAACLENWVEREEYTRLYKRFKDIMGQRPRNVSLKEAEEWGRRAFVRMSEPDEAKK